MNPSDLKYLELESIVSPGSVAEFFANVHEKTFLVCKGAVPREICTQLLSPSSFDRLLTCQQIVSDRVDIIDERGKVEMRPPQTLMSVPDLVARVRAGASVRIKALHTFVPEIAEAAVVLGRDMQQEARVNLYFTPGNGAGMERHFDDHDVWILQCWGMKRWTLSPEYSNRVEVPRRRSRFSDQQHVTGQSTVVDLEAGDLLYVPRGVVHAVSCEAVGSLHLTFGLHGATLEDVLLHCISTAARERVFLRKRVLLQPQRRALDVGGELQDEIAQLFTPERITAALASMAGQQLDTVHTPLPGLVLDAIAASPQRPGTAAVRLRPAAAYRVFEIEGHTVLITPTRRIFLESAEQEVFRDLERGMTLEPTVLARVHGTQPVKEFLDNLGALGLLEWLERASATQSDLEMETV